MRSLRHLLLLGLLLAPAGMVFAQPPPGITENPEGAVRLRTIFRLIGGGSEETRVALAFGPAGDVNNDGYDDFFVTRRLRWDLYLGSPVPSTQPAWSFPSEAQRLSSDPGTVVGDFFGDGTMLVGLRDDRCTPNLSCYARIRFFRPHVDSLLVETPWILDLGEQPDGFRAFARDLDQDEDHELVVINKEDDSVAVRIYEGGSGFEIQMPSHVFSMQAESSHSDSRSIFSAVETSDEDTFPDLLIGTRSRADGQTQLLFWWGDEGSIGGWQQPSRIIEKISDSTGIEAPSLGFPQDIDGDGQPDFMGRIRVGDQPGSYIWLSRNRESIRTRTFDQTTNDIFFPDATWSPSFGYIADSLQRYEMLTLLGGQDAYGLGGGLYGPNNTYDAHFGGSDGPAFGGIDVGDVDGNGWRDRLAASPTYGGPNVGGAVVIAGGPYIPVDDPTVSVESAPVAGEARGLSLWPNPVVENLHIAWRGDLPQMPHLMRIYNALGELIEERGLPTWKGTTTWNAARHPAGIYTIVIFDAENRQLGTLPFVLQP